MTTPEMHVMFRQYAQQMGMQNVRAILPEQIDLLLNTSIMDVTNQVIKDNIGITNDRVITDNSKIGQINALKSLYHVHYIELSPNFNSANKEETRAFTFFASDRNTGRMTTNFERISNNSFIPNYMFLVDFSINYKKVSNKLGYNGKNTVLLEKSYDILRPIGCIDGTDDYLKRNVSSSDIIDLEVYIAAEKKVKRLEFNLFIDFRLDPLTGKEKAYLKCITPEYTQYYLGVEGVNNTDESYGGKQYVLTTNFNDGDENFNNGVIYNPLVINSNVKVFDYVSPTFEIDGLETNYFPVRIIDDAYLADTLNDFVLKNRIRSPIIVTYNNSNDNVFDLYIDKFKKTDNDRYVLDGDLVPYMLRMSYIAKPAEVKYLEDLGPDNKNCDLPEYMHIDIVKHAVDLYRIALSGSMMAAQQQEQNARQENMRNNYRNEGNTQ